jgi:hypothetical protein
MSTDPCSELPDERNWSFEQILAAEPQRVAVLTMEEPPAMLLAAIQEEFAAAVRLTMSASGRSSRAQRLRTFVRSFSSLSPPNYSTSSSMRGQAIERTMSAV